MRLCAPAMGRAPLPDCELKALRAPASFGTARRATGRFRRQVYDFARSTQGSRRFRGAPASVNDGGAASRGWSTATTQAPETVHLMLPHGD